MRPENSASSCGHWLPFPGWSRQEEPERLLGYTQEHVVVAASRFTVRAWNFYRDWQELNDAEQVECLE